MFETMILDCLDYILINQNNDVNKLELTILANDISKFFIDNLILIADRVKVLNIVTNNVKKFRNVEEKIREKFGIIVRIKNNKRRSLSNAKIIINIDFDEELINEYQIYEKAIIISINQKIKIHSKKFNGINACNYNISANYNMLYENFEVKDVIEGIIIKENNIFEARKRLKEENVIITNLIGNNGVISPKEYANFA